ncbi:uncharacterized protein LOC107324099 [Coturnix japonica]|uniref:uncharacterized protein LOC107324099 n=1 Tax=Coturnix japonica TaxID=93934 RepID=UPI000777950A|nr:uncharacterized protein LOC107324099 [Coturnix japonica]
MGNNISHESYCRRSGKPEKQAAEQEKAEADPSTAQESLLGSSENPLPKEKSLDAAVGMQNKETETASSSLQCMQDSVPQAAVQSMEMEDHGETQPPVQEPEVTETEPAIMTSDMLMCALTQEGAATAQPAAGDAEVTKTDLALQAAGEVGDKEAEDVVTNQAAVEKHSSVYKRSSGRLCKPSPLCRWLKKLKSSAEKK